MCSSPSVPDPKPVKVPEPAPAPPPPEPTAESPMTQEGAGRTAAKSAEQRSKKRGTQSLRIDLNLAQPGGQGLNIPRG